MAAVALVAGSLVAAGAAYADSAPTTPSTSNPATVSATSLPTPQINGVVWTQVVVGSTVFVGGHFSTARPYGAPAKTSTVARTGILAYDLTTGTLLKSFAPKLNGQVLAIAPTADKKHIYIGGTFTTVDGTKKSRIAKLSSTSGKLVTSFHASATSTVRAIEERGSSVYIGGHFSALNGHARTQLGAVSTSTGALSSWAPRLKGGDVSSIAISPGGTRVVIGGMFVSVGGSSTYGYGLASLSRSTGKSSTFTIDRLVRNAGTSSGITSLTATPGGVVGTGYDYGVGGNFEGTFYADWKTGKVLWIADCHGDTYSAAVSGKVVYTAGHNHYCGNLGGFRDTKPATHRRAVAFSLAATQKLTSNGATFANFHGKPAPSLLNWFPDLAIGTYTGQNQAAWSVAATSKYVLYGGEFTAVNGVPQQGLARFAVASLSTNSLGPVSSGAGFVPTVTSTTPGQATVSWTSNADPDNSTLTYNVYRDGSAEPIYTTRANSSVWYRPRLSWTDTAIVPGQTYSYRISAADPFGNTVRGDDVAVTAASSAPAAYAQSVLRDAPKSFWRLSGGTGASGSTLADETGLAPLTVFGAVAPGVPGSSLDGTTATTFAGSASTFAGTPQPSKPSTTAQTIEAWVKVDKGQGGVVVTFGDSIGRTSVQTDRTLFVSTSGLPGFAMRDTVVGVKGTRSIADGAWHQVAAVATSTSLALYVDGAVVAKKSTGVALTSSYGYWRIAGDRSTVSRAFLTGSVDDVSVYSAALSAGRIHAHWLAAKGL